MYIVYSSIVHVEKTYSCIELDIPYREKLKIYNWTLDIKNLLCCYVQTLEVASKLMHV